MRKLPTFLFNKNISVCGISNSQSFNDTLINGIVSFEQLGPVVLSEHSLKNVDACLLLFSQYITEKHEGVYNMDVFK